MDKFTGVIGIIIILGIAYAMSNNRKKISLKTVINGLILQFLLGLFVLKVPLGQFIFKSLGAFIGKILDFAMEGANFIFGVLTSNPERMKELFGSDPGILAFKLIPAIIFIMILTNILYYYGIMQKIVAILSKAMYKIMNVSGAEALSNVSSGFVGQVVAQIMIKPYLPNLTKSEILASMSGSMACIAAGMMAIYISIGIPAEYLLAATVMAAPGALVISKIVYPETEESETKDSVKITVEKTAINVLDSIAQGAADGLKISLNVLAMLVALIALIGLVDWMIGGIGMFLTNIVGLGHIGLDLSDLSLKLILGKLFSIFAVIMGVSIEHADYVGQLLGTKFVLNETISYFDLAATSIQLPVKDYAIVVFALCGFANVSSVAVQIGGIGEMIPHRRKDLAALGGKALICGTLASYVSAAMAGILCG